MKYIKILINWLFILSSPIWILPLIAFCVYQDWKDDNLNDVCTGEDWFWEW